MKIARKCQIIWSFSINFVRWFHLNSHRSAVHSQGTRLSKFQQMDNSAILYNQENNLSNWLTNANNLKMSDHSIFFKQICQMISSKLWQCNKTLPIISPVDKYRQAKILTAANSRTMTAIQCQGTKWSKIYKILIEYQDLVESRSYQYFVLKAEAIKIL